MSRNAKILVTGLPGDMKLKMLVAAFKTLFKKVYIKKFWIRELSDSDNIDGDFKEMTVEFKYKAEAHRAQNFLNGKPFSHKMMKYPLVVHILEESTDTGNENSCIDLRNEQATIRMHSHSPGYRQESSTLDECSPCTSREFDRYRDSESHDTRHKLCSVSQTSREKYTPMEKEKQWSSYSTYSPEGSRNSRHPSAHSRYSSPYSRYSSAHSRYSSVRARYSPTHSRYPPITSNNSRQSQRHIVNSNESDQMYRNTSLRL